MKKFLALTLALVLVVGLLPLNARAAQSGSWGDQQTWTLEEGVLTISGYGDMAHADYVYDGAGEIIGTTAPWYGMEVTDVVIAEGISSVGNLAFLGMDTVETVSLPHNLTVIGYDAFRGCTALTTINLPDTLTVLDVCAFEGCVSLQGPLEIPDLVTRLEDRVFYGCTSLTEVLLPEGLYYLGMEAFRYSGIQELTLPTPLEFLGLGALADCPDLTAIHVAGGNPHLSSDAQGALYNLEQTTLHQLPGGFCGAYTMPATVTRLDALWSAGCRELTELNINANLQELEYQSLADCENLEFIRVDGANPSLRADENGVLYGKVKGGEALYHVPALYAADSTFRVPENVVFIGDSAFRHCDFLTDIVIPAGVAAIEPATFYGCDSLTGIWFDENHPGYRSNEEGIVFSADGTVLQFYPTGLSGYYAIPEGVTDIGGCAFAGANVEALRLPSSLEFIGTWAFQDCEALADLLFTGEKPRASYIGALSSITANVHYPDWLASWADPDLEGEGLTYIPYSADAVPTLPGQSEEPVECPFTDVPLGQWYTEPVLWAVEKGVTNGMGDGTFGVNLPCNRAQVVTFLWRAAGCPEPASTDCPFTDVDVNQWYGKPVLWAVENGITNGVSVTEFGINLPCNRATVVTFLWRAEGKPEPASADCPFTDVDMSQWYGKPVLWAVENGITNGMGDGTFGINGICNRAQVVTFLYRAMA